MFEIFVLLRGLHNIFDPFMHNTRKWTNILKNYDGIYTSLDF